jgi:hypothetical protein
MVRTHKRFDVSKSCDQLNDKGDVCLIAELFVASNWQRGQCLKYVLATVLAAVLCDMGDESAVAFFAGFARHIHSFRKPFIIALTHPSHARAVTIPAPRLNSLMAEAYLSIRRDFSGHSGK